MERRMMREKVGSKIACSSENGDRKEREWILTLESEWGGGLLPERRNKPKLMQFYCAERERKTFVLDLWRRRMPYCIFSFFFLVQLHLLLTLWFFTGAHSKSPFFFMTPQQIIFFFDITTAYHFGSTLSIMLYIDQKWFIDTSIFIFLLCEWFIDT